MKTINDVPGAPAPVGAYSLAVEANGMLFCSGQIPIDPATGEFVSGGVSEQAAQVFKNLDAVLRAGGSSPEQIVMSSIFLANMEDFPAVNDLYAGFVSSENPPARQTVAVKDLPKGALVEVSVIAVCGS